MNEFGLNAKKLQMFLANICNQKVFKNKNRYFKALKRISTG
jgi:hypothetical protein